MFGATSSRSLLSRVCPRLVERLRAAQTVRVTPAGARRRDPSDLRLDLEIQAAREAYDRLQNSARCSPELARRVVALNLRYLRLHSRQVGEMNAATLARFTLDREGGELSPALFNRRRTSPRNVQIFICDGSRRPSSSAKCSRTTDPRGRPFRSQSAYRQSYISVHIGNMFPDPRYKTRASFRDAALRPRFFKARIRRRPPVAS